MRVICISGVARSGKDTAASYMKKKYEADGKRVLITHYADLLKYLCKSLFGWNGVKDDEGRKLLQYVGTDVVRTKNPDYWVNFMIGMLDLFYGEWDYVLIPDCRFPNEVDRLYENNFDVCSVRIIRDKFTNNLTKEQQEHPSETAMNNYNFNYIVHNNTMGEFYKNLNELMKYIDKDFEDNEANKTMIS